MTIRTAKATRSKSAKPQPAPTAATGDPAESKPNSGSKPNALIASSFMPVTADMRQAMIAEAAYYIAQERGFAQGGEVEDWLRAEAQIDAKLSA